LAVFDLVHGSPSVVSQSPEFSKNDKLLSLLVELAPTKHFLNGFGFESAIVFGESFKGAKQLKNLKNARSFAPLRMTKKYFGGLSKYLFRGDADSPLWQPHAIS
jgi:hypothetical protein